MTYTIELYYHCEKTEFYPAGTYYKDTLCFNDLVQCLQACKFYDSLGYDVKVFQEDKTKFLWKEFLENPMNLESPMNKE